MLKIANNLRFQLFLLVVKLIKLLIVKIMNMYISIMVEKNLLFTLIHSIIRKDKNL
jgi:hypothetical protein